MTKAGTRAVSASLAYFTNEYPSVSHSFIRREIQAIERMGFVVHRFSLREGDGLIDVQDIHELERTTRLSPVGPADVFHVLGVLLSRPIRAARALRMTFSIAMRRPGFPRPLFAIVWAALLVRHFRKRGVGHVHGHFGTNSVCVLRLVRAMGGPTFSFTNHAPFEIEPPWAWSLSEKVAEAEFVAAISQLAKAQLMRVTDPGLWDRISIVRCGLDLDACRSTPVPDTSQILCVARLSEEKGHRVLLNALSALHSDGVDFELVIVGDGPLRAELEREVMRLDFSANVEFAGSVDESEVNRLLAGSRVLVLPSFAEGLPVVLMEAFRAGRPVVSSNVGAIAELVEEGSSGWLVSPGDDKGLARALRVSLETPPQVLTQMGKKGRQRLEEKHDSVREAAKLGALFGELLDEARCAATANVLLDTNAPH